MKLQFYKLVPRPQFFYHSDANIADCVERWFMEDAGSDSYHTGSNWCTFSQFIL